MASDIFAVLLCFTVISSILDVALRRAVASETWRVTAPGEHMLRFDVTYNHPSNSAVLGVPFSNVRALLPKGTSVDTKRTALALPPSRRSASRTDWLASTLEWSR